MDSNLVFFGLAGILATIAKLIILLASILLLVKRRSAATWLMLAGSLLFVLDGLGSALGAYLIARASGPEALIRFQWVLQMTGGLALMLFGAGFLIWVLGLNRGAGIQQGPHQ